MHVAKTRIYWKNEFGLQARKSDCNAVNKLKSGFFCLRQQSETEKKSEKFGKCLSLAR